MYNKENRIDYKAFVELMSNHHENSKLIEFNDIYGLELFRNGFKYGFFIPYGLYIHDNLNFNSLKQFLIQIHNKSFSNLTINISPNCNIKKSEIESLAKEYNYSIITNHCHILNTTRSISEIFEQFNDTRKKHIKRYLKAEKIKVFCSTDAIYFEKYYDLYEDSLKRWGETTGSYSKELIYDLHKINGIKIWVAEVDNQMISGMICIYTANGVFDWLAASIINDDYKKLYPAVAVQYEVIKDACENGLSFVNMGASVNLDGVSDFKDSWGAELFETYSLNKKSTLFNVSKKIINFVKKIKQ